jgi:cell division protein FtsB
MRKVPANAVFFLLAAFLIVLQYRLWFEQDGVRDMLVLKKSLTRQEQVMQAQKKQNDELIFQVKKMQKSKDATESRARGELGMIKKGETFYQYVNEG